MATAHIYIYGEIGWWQSKDAADWGEVNLTQVREQYEAQKDCEDITVHIHSPGGVVTEGYAIHDYIRSQGKPVTTVIEGMCASIATVIALSGDVRMMTSNSEFMVHFPSGGGWGTSEEIQRAADHLKTLEVNAANFYAAKTNLTADEAIELMRNETFMTAEKALEHGFVTEIASTMKAVAKFDLQTKNKSKMSKNKMTKEQTESKLDAMLSKMKNFITGETPKMKLVTAADGETEIDFTDLEDDDTPSVGDVATVDGVAAEGEYLMPNGETYVFTTGELTEIKPSEEDEEDDSDEEMTQLKADNAEMKAQAVKDAKKMKALQKTATENKERLDEATQMMAAMQKDMKAVKASMSSGFESEEEDGNTNKGKKTTSRQVFKTQK